MKSEEFEKMKNANYLIGNKAQQKILHSSFLILH